MSYTKGIKLYVKLPPPPTHLLFPQRLAGATLLIFANKQDLPGALSCNAIQEVSQALVLSKAEGSLGLYYFDFTVVLFCFFETGFWQP